MLGTQEVVGWFFFKVNLLNIYLCDSEMGPQKGGRGCSSSEAVALRSQRDKREPQSAFSHLPAHLPGPCCPVVTRAGGVSSFQSEENPPTVHRRTWSPTPSWLPSPSSPVSPCPCAACGWHAVGAHACCSLTSWLAGPELRGTKGWGLPGRQSPCSERLTALRAWGACANPQPVTAAASAGQPPPVTVRFLS